ncbi:molecular chaperone [Pseudomonas aeruginosa]|uniref:fimbrial biogenesis chaperone n=1 Tax=Pseudomonas aeruginosa TaxID=287 RepID=UPI002A6B7021|nr:molecular chaperone [Pseudomonas aeruginosa]MDY1310987.1 molecular chaperone [Pseudomonas aeruginosa]MDY1425848.1 molecular chaperone [Pseudomonas aeruginosa]MDY1480711.1 molecular chaperone [Pseudomonas aeruginosa]HCF3966898.1 molecular chaperone [Pseudomonas aeruginosa]HCF3969291.1 molecular chaperone [Pseudomonas aeruginosa]
MNILFRAIVLLIGGIPLYSFSIPLYSFSEVHLVGASRVIFEGGHRVRVDFANGGSRESLIKLNILDGESGSENIPLVLTKPLLILPPSGQKSVDILYQGKGLPKDRESYFLLSVLDVPVKPGRENTAQIALRHYYKVLYRPKGLEKPSGVVTASLWRRKSENGTVEVLNNSPYYMTLTGVRFRDANGKKCQVIIEHVMIAPFFKKDFLDLGCSERPSEVEFGLVKDSGQETNYKVGLQEEL